MFIAPSRLKYGRIFRPSKAVAEVVGDPIRKPRIDMPEGMEQKMKEIRDVVKEAAKLPVQKKRDIGLLGGLGVDIAMEALMAPMIYGSRKEAGESDFQAVTGTGLGALGSLAGTYLGSKLFRFHPGAELIGGFAGGWVGGDLGSRGADMMTGVGREPVPAESGQQASGPERIALSSLDRNTAANYVAAYQMGVTQPWG